MIIDLGTRVKSCSKVFSTIHNKKKTEGLAKREKALYNIVIRLTRGVLGLQRRMV